MSDPLALFFQKEGTILKVLPGKPLPLDRENTLYFLCEGELSLYLEKGEGHSRYFLRVLSDTLLFGSSKEDYSFLVESKKEVELLSLPKEKMASFYEESLKNSFLFYLEKWVFSLAEKIAFSPSQEVKKISVFSENFSAELGEVLYLKEGEFQAKRPSIFWVVFKKGKVSFLGLEPLLVEPSSPPFPITGKVWMEVREDVDVEVLKTEDLIAKKEVDLALSQLHHFFLKSFPVQIEWRQQEDEKARKSRRVEEVQDLEISLGRLEEILSHPHREEPLRKDALEKVLQIGAKELYIELVYPPFLQEENVMQRCEAIFKASFIPFRKSILEGKWWKEDHGSFFAFYEGKLVFCKKKRGRYIAIGDDFTVVASKKVQAHFSEEVIVIYAPFKLKVHTGREVFLEVWKRAKPLLLSMLIYGVFGSVLAFFPSIATSLIFKYAIPENSYALLDYMTLGLLFTSVGVGFFQWIRESLFLKMEGILMHFVQPALWDRLLKLSPSFFRRFTVANLFWRIFCVEQIHILVSTVGSSQIINSFFSFLFLIVMFIFAPLLALFACLVALFSLSISVVLSRVKARLMQKVFEHDAEARSIVFQALSGIHKIRASSSEKGIFSAWVNFFSKKIRFFLRAQNLETVVTALNASSPILSYAGFYLLLLGVIGIHGISLPDFLAFNLGFGSFYSAFYPINFALIEMANIVPLWKRAKVVLEEPVEESIEKSSPGKLSGEIEIEHLSFGYDPERPPVLNNISLEIKPHQFVAIVGQSGVGKSTLLRLLLGFERPVSGAIYYDGKDLAKLDVQKLRKQIGIVLQENSLVAGSLLQNLMADEEYTEEMIEKALHLSGFIEDLYELPMGLHTFVQMGGGGLSGGQRQRFLLARALVGDPSLLIFDEATSALDNRSQEKIVKNLEELQVTRIVVAQRLSTIRRADQIYVVGDGKVQQQGSYESLAKEAGIFAEMLARQKFN